MTQEKGATDNLRSTAAQVLASLAFSTINSSAGVIIAMPTIVIGALRNENSPLALSESQASWFGSLMYLAQPFGSLVSGHLQDALGRKTCLILINIPSLVAWIIIYFSTSVIHLYIAVCLMGMAIGFMEAPILSYIGEVTQPRLRGVLSSSGQVFSNLGMMLEGFLGATVPWRTMVLYCTAGPIMGIICTSMVPDSPAWLVTKGRLKEAEKAYQWLRGWVSPEAVKEELDALVAYVRNTSTTKGLELEDMAVPLKDGERGDVDKPPIKGKSDWELVTEPEVLTAFRIIIIYFIVSLSASLIALRPFFIEILTDLHSPVKPHYVVAICGVLQLLGAISMVLAIKTLGKRGVTFLSLGICNFCCLGLGMYFYLGIDIPWIPVILFCISYYSSTTGIIGVPWVLIVELFPLRAKGLGGGISAAMAYIAWFIITKTYYNLVSLVNISGACFIYGAIGVLGFIYLYVDMPETEGVSLEVIERRLSERRSTRQKTINRNGEVRAAEDN